MSKKAKKKDKEEIIQKYQNEGIIESELDQIAKDDMEINNLKTKLTSLSLDFRKKEAKSKFDKNNIK